MESQNVTQDLTTNKIKRKLRYSGIIAASFILAQCVIWIIFCIIGICCFFSNGKIDTIKFDAFKYIYLYSQDEVHAPTLVSPIVFNLICWFYLIGCCVWLVISVRLIQALSDWNNFYIIRKSLKIWIFFTFSVCVIDLLFSALFLIDFKLTLRRKFYTHDEGPYEFKASDSFDMSLDENLKEIKVIGNIERDIRNELKEYLLLKAQVKNQFIHGFISSAANNDTFINPFHRVVKKIKREITYTRGKYNHIVVALNQMKLAPNNEKRLEIPSAILMTIFIRGIIVWVVNLIMVAYISNLYFC